MARSRIPVAGPWITQKEIDYVTDAVTNAWYDKANNYHRRFEAAFAEYVGRKYAMALPSCTSALHLALMSLGVGPGDEVIVPEITWIATAAPISYVGAEPVFADIDKDSWCLDSKSLKDSITTRTKAVIVVDLYGNMPDMNAIVDLARTHGIAIIEDAAEAIGSEYRGRKAGSFGEVSTFSFHGSKTLTTGEGGMLLTDDRALLKRCRFLADHGRAPGERLFWNSEIAHKYKMSSMQAALGLAQLERIEELVERKRQIFDWYRESLEGVEGLTLNYESPDIKNTYWMVTAVASELGLEKELFIGKLREKGIDCRPVFYPLSSLPAYSKLPQSGEARARNASAYALSPFGVNLPSGFDLTRDKVHHVCAQVRTILSDWRQALSRKSLSEAGAVSLTPERRVDSSNAYRGGTSEDLPLVSIGLPVRNGERHIKGALDSLLAQDYGNFELIISDNASEDRTREVCLEYAAKDPRIHYFRNETDLGAVRNFNRTFELSRGEFFMWAGHHDLWMPTFISRCLTKMNEHKEAVLCFSPIDLIDNDGYRIGAYEENINTLHMDMPGRFHVVLWRLRWQLGAGATIHGLIRSEALRRTRLTQNSYGADWVLLLELSLLGPFVTVPETLFSLRAAHPETRTIKDQIDSLAPVNRRKAFRAPFWNLTLGVIKGIVHARINWLLKLLLIGDAVYSIDRKLNLRREIIVTCRNPLGAGSLHPAAGERE